MKASLLQKTIAVLALAALSFGAAAQALSVSEQGLGAVGAQTRFSQKALQAGLPGFIVRPKIRSTEGEAYRVFVVNDGPSTLAVVTPDQSQRGIFSIRVVSTAVTNALGPRIGDSYAKVYGGTAGKDCVPGEEELSGKVICPHAQGSKVLYVFHDAQGSYNGPDGTLPPKSQLAKFEIEEIVWRP